MSIRCFLYFFFYFSVCLKCFIIQYWSGERELDIQQIAKGISTGRQADIAKVCMSRFYFSKINNDKNTFMYVCIIVHIYL